MNPIASHAARVTWVCALTLTGCWPGPLDRLGRDAGQIDAAAQAFQSLAPCRNAGDFQTGSTTISFGGPLGNEYAPRCLLVSAGATVVFSGSFSPHPLTPSRRGSAASPIVESTTGSSATFAFPSPGFYPFYCARHGDDSGGGMSGMIQVAP